MIEKEILEYLKKRLSVPVFMEKPEKPPEKYVLIEKIGGSKSEHILSASIAFQSYADSLYSAVDLDDELRGAMDNIIELDIIVSAKLVRNYNFTDTTKKKYRYQSIYELVHY